MAEEKKLYIIFLKIFGNFLQFDSYGNEAFLSNIRPTKCNSKVVYVIWPCRTEKALEMHGTLTKVLENFNNYVFRAIEYNYKCHK